MQSSDHVTAGPVPNSAAPGGPGRDEQIVAESGPAGQTADVLLERARELVPSLRERIAETEELRMLPEATMRDSIDAGFLSLLLPRTLGGAGGGLAEYVELIRILATGDPTAAWTLGFFTAHNWFFARWPEEAQQEFFASGVPALQSSVSLPPGRAEPTDGGYLVTGYWGYCSGVMNADWVELIVVIDGQEGLKKVVVPRDEIEVVDTWRMAGMAGTGSHHVKLDGVFVPQVRTLDLPLWASRQNPGSELYPEPLYSYDLRDVLTFMIPTIIFGAAEALVELYRERLDNRREVFSQTVTGDTAYGQLRYARSVGALRAARAVLDHAVSEVIEANARSTESMSDELRAQLKLDCLSVCRLSREAAELALDGSGSAIYRSSDITQHFARDMQVALSHLTIDHDVMATQAGRILLGRATEPQPANQFL